MDPDIPEVQATETLADLIYNAEITDNPEESEVQDTEQKATIEELASVLLHPEEIPVGSKREFAINLYKSFRSCQIFMSTLCRFPIISHENDDHLIVFEYNWNSFRGSMFFVTLFILFIITVLSSIGVVCTMLNVRSHPKENLTVYWDVKTNEVGEIQWEPIFQSLSAYPKWTKTVKREVKFIKTQTLLRAEEMFIFRRNLASLLIVLFHLYHIVFSDWSLYHRRDFVAHYLTFWTESVEIMKIDAAAGDAKKFTRRFILYYVIWFTLFCCAIAINVAPVSTGAPVSFTFLWVRLGYPSIHAVNDLTIYILRCVGGFIILFVILCSKVYVFFFLYICKILTTVCTVWNERLESVFTAEERKKTRKEKCAARTGFDHLFKDYVTLLDLLSGADTLFTNIIESYFSMTLMSIVFEVYYLVRPLAETQFEFSGARSFDMILVGLYLCNSLMVFYLVSTGAAEVGEASANGLEIIRRQGIMGHRSDSEMHFMISLYMSYTGHFDTALAGGGYFILDKSFCVALAGTLISYIIIIFQFQPALGLSNREQQNLIGYDDDDPTMFRTLITHVENTFYYQENREPKS